jgi:hypothetical protein
MQILSFGSTCDELTLKIAAAEDQDIAAALRAERKEHLLEADRGYAMRKHDQDLARQCRASDKKWVCPAAEHASWDSTEFICSDMVLHMIHTMEIHTIYVYVHTHPRAPTQTHTHTHTDTHTHTHAGGRAANAQGAD